MFYYSGEMRQKKPRVTHTSVDGACCYIAREYFFFLFLFSLCVQEEKSARKVSQATPAESDRSRSKPFHGLLVTSGPWVRQHFN